MYIKSLRSENTINSFSDFLSIKGKIQKIIAISAYVDIESMRAVVALIKSNKYSAKKPSLRFFIDKSSSHFFSDLDSRKNLIDLDIDIVKFCDSESGIYLVQFGVLFHSKAYLVEGNGNGKLILGSLNLTSKGISSNEELVICEEFDVNGKSNGRALARWIDKYAENLHKKSVRANDSELESLRGSIFCMRQMLLDGLIWYEMKEQNPFRFNLHLPDNLVSQQANIDPLLDASVTDSISVDRLITAVAPYGLGVELCKLGDSKALWKKYCIETCYGHWNPECLAQELANQLEKRRVSRTPYYDALRKNIFDNKSQLRDCFLQLQVRIQLYLTRNGHGVWKYAKPKDAANAWDQWIDRVLAKVANRDFYERLIVGVASVPTPDVWGDPLSANEFEESLCDSLIYIWSKQDVKQSSNVVAQNIAWNLDLEDDVQGELDTEKLKTLMEDWMLKYGSSIVRDINDGN